MIRVTLLRIWAGWRPREGAWRPALRGCRLVTALPTKPAVCTNYCIVRAGRRDHGADMMESTVSFPAVFFAAIIGVIIFIALSAVLLEPRE